MRLSHPVVISLLVGVTLLCSPALLLQFQEPLECANAVEPVGQTAQTGEPVEVFQYEALSPDAQRTFDRAQAADGSVIVTGESCPTEFAYTADTHRYEVVKDDSRYVLTTYANDLIPEVPIAAAVVAVLGATLVGIGLATSGEPEAQFPVWASAVGLVAFAMVTAAVVLDQALWKAIGGTALLTGLVLVVSGAALRPRRALLLGGGLSVLPALVVVPLAGVSMLLVLPAALPLFLVGAGIGIGRIASVVGEPA